MLKGLITAGGNATRLRPVTLVTNKHLLPIYNKPMIYYPLETLIAAGVKEVMIVTGREYAGDFMNLLGSGREFGITITYRVQDEAGGIAQVVGMAEQFTGSDSLMVILGDNIFEARAEIVKGVEQFKKQKDGSMIFLKEVHDPQRFGVAEVKGEKILGIVEKPSEPKSSLAVTGLYLYDNTVFEIIKNMKPSARGELEITDVNNAYIERGNMTYHILDGDWTDAGTFDSLLHANNLVAKKMAEAKK